MTLRSFLCVSSVTLADFITFPYFSYSAHARNPLRGNLTLAFIRNLCYSFSRIGGRGFRMFGPNIEKMEKKKDVIGLIKVIRRESWYGFEVSNNAVEALARIGEPAVESLIQILKDKDRHVRFDAANVLRRIGDARAVEPLIQALKDEYDLVRLQAIEGLGRIGDARSVEPLIQALTYEYPDRNYEYTQKQVAEALVGIGRPAVALLIRALEDKDLRVREVAAVALGKIGDETAAEPLIQALKDQYWSVRCRAAEALVRIRGPAAEPFIRAMRAEGTNLVRVYVILNRREISPQEYAERARQVFGYSPGALVVGTPPSDETFAKNAIRAVCGDIWSSSPIPEVRIDKDRTAIGPRLQGLYGDRTQYAINFLKQRISEGYDPDYFQVAGYDLQVNFSVDRITGDEALVIRIYQQQ